MNSIPRLIGFYLIVVLLYLPGCSLFRTAAQDEAMQQGKTVAGFPGNSR